MTRRGAEGHKTSVFEEKVATFPRCCSHRGRSCSRPVGGAAEGGRKCEREANIKTEEEENVEEDGQDCFFGSPYFISRWAEGNHTLHLTVGARAVGETQPSFAPGRPTVHRQFRWIPPTRAPRNTTPPSVRQHKLHTTRPLSRSSCRAESRLRSVVQIDLGRLDGWGSHRRPVPTTRPVDRHDPPRPTPE